MPSALVHHVIRSTVLLLNPFDGVKLLKYLAVSFKWRCVDDVVLLHTEKKTLKGRLGAS